MVFRRFACSGRCLADLRRLCLARAAELSTLAEQIDTPADPPST